MIGFDAAGVRYGARWIFRNLTMAVPPGRCLAVLGPNGQGKTTLVRALLGFLPLSEGTRQAPSVIGYVPQAVGRDIAYRVGTVVTMGRVARRGLFALPQSADYEAAEEALSRVGLAPLIDRVFDQLSGGEKQLVLLARALATGADTLVLDEPASALDLKNQDLFLSVLDGLRRAGRHAILFTTHLPQHAGAVADDALLMYGVEERLHGSAEAVLTEDALCRLYGIDLKIISVEGDDPARPTRAILPLFGRRAGSRC